MKALIFPGQGSQFEGMGKDLYESSDQAKKIFNNSNNILGFDITDVMFNGSKDDLKKTDITQPAIFIHSYVCYELGKVRRPDAYAGHSLGEFTALVCSGSLSFEDGLGLVLERARAMNSACSESDSTMAAILGLEDDLVKKICKDFDDIDPANFNCNGQVVISGSSETMPTVCDVFKENGAKAIPLMVGGGFHSKYMEPAKSKLEDAINSMTFAKPNAPIYQNVDSKGNEDINLIKENLISQLTSPVLWTQTINNMISDNINLFIECGPGRVLQGLVKKINRDINFRGHSIESITDTIIRRMDDYVYYIVPQFSRTHINFQRVPTVDTSNPFGYSKIPEEEESFIVIKFNARINTIEYQDIISEIPGFMTRQDTIVVPGARGSDAMKIILGPRIQELVEAGRIKRSKI